MNPGASYSVKGTAQENLIDTLPTPVPAPPHSDVEMRVAPAA